MLGGEEMICPGPSGGSSFETFETDESKSWMLESTATDTLSDHGPVLRHHPLEYSSSIRTANEAATFSNPNSSLALPTNDIMDGKDPQPLLDLCTQIEASANSAILAEEKDLLILIGKAGAGKTTLVHHLCGKIIEDSNSHDQESAKSSKSARDPSSSPSDNWEVIDGLDAAAKNCKDAKDAKGKKRQFSSQINKKFDVKPNDCIPGLTIGHKAHSETSSVHIVDPNPYLQFGNMVLPLIADSPGFMDTLGAFKDIANNASIFYAVSKAKSVRLCLVASYDSVKEGKLDNLREILTCVSNLVKDLPNRIHCLAIIMTHVPKEMANVDGNDKEFPSGDLDIFLRNSFQNILTSDKNVSNKPAMLELVRKLQVYVTHSIKEDGLPIEQQMIRPYHPEVHSSPVNIWKMLLHRKPIEDTAVAFDMPLADKSLNQIALDLHIYGNKFNESVKAHPMTQSDLDYISCMFRICMPFIRMSATITPIVKYYNRCVQAVLENYKERWADVNNALRDLIVHGTHIQPPQLESLLPRLGSMCALFDHVISKPANCFDLTAIAPPQVLVTSCLNMLRKDVIESIQSQRVADFKQNPDCFRTTWCLDVKNTMDKCEVLRSFFKNIFGSQEAMRLDAVYEEAAKSAMDLFHAFVAFFQVSVPKVSGEELVKLNEWREHFKVLKSYRVLIDDLNVGLEATSVHMNSKCSAAVADIDNLVKHDSLAAIAEKIVDLPEVWQVLRAFDSNQPRMPSMDIPGYDGDLSESVVASNSKKVLEWMQVRFPDDLKLRGNLFEKSMVPLPTSRIAWTPAENLMRLILEVFCLDVLASLDDDFRKICLKKITRRTDLLARSLQQEFQFSLSSASMDGGALSGASSNNSLGAGEINAAGAVASHRQTLCLLVYLTRIVDCVTGTREIAFPLLREQLHQKIFQMMIRRPADLVLKELVKLERIRGHPAKWKADFVDQVKNLTSALNASFLSIQDIDDWWAEVDNWISIEIQGIGDSFSNHSSVETDGTECQITLGLAQTILSFKMPAARQASALDRIRELITDFDQGVTTVRDQMRAGFGGTINSRIKALERYLTCKKWNQLKDTMDDLERLRRFEFLEEDVSKALTLMRETLRTDLERMTERLKSRLSEKRSWHISETWRTAKQDLQNIKSLLEILSSLDDQEIHSEDALDDLQELVLNNLDTFVSEQMKLLSNSEANSKTNAPFSLFSREYPRAGSESAAFWKQEASSSNQPRDESELGYACMRIEPSEVQRVFHFAEEACKSLDASSERVQKIAESLDLLKKRYEDLHTAIDTEFSNALNEKDAKKLVKILKANEDFEPSSNSTSSRIPRGVYLRMLHYLPGHLGKEHHRIEEQLKKLLSDAEAFLDCGSSSDNNIFDQEGISRFFEGTFGRGMEGIVNSAPGSTENMAQGASASASAATKSIIPVYLLDSLKKYQDCMDALQPHLSLLASDSSPSSETSSKPRGDNTDKIFISSNMHYMRSLAQVFHEFCRRVQTAHFGAIESPRRFEAGLCLLQILKETEPTIGKALGSNFVLQVRKTVAKELQVTMRCIINVRDPDEPSRYGDRLVSLENGVRVLPEQSKLKLIETFKGESIKKLTGWLNHWLGRLKDSVEDLAEFNQNLPKNIQKSKHRSLASATGSSANKTPVLPVQQNDPQSETQRDGDFTSSDSTNTSGRSGAEDVNGHAPNWDRKSIPGFEILMALFVKLVIEEGICDLPDETRRLVLSNSLQKKKESILSNLNAVFENLTSILRELLTDYDGDVVIGLLPCSVNEETLAGALRKEIAQIGDDDQSTDSLRTYRWLTRSTEILESDYMSKLREQIAMQREDRLTQNEEILNRFVQNTATESFKLPWGDIESAMNSIGKELKRKYEDNLLNNNRSNHGAKNAPDRKANRAMSLEKLYKTSCSQLLTRLQTAHRTIGAASSLNFPGAGMTTEENRLKNSLKASVVYLSIFTILLQIKAVWKSFYYIFDREISDYINNLHSSAMVTTERATVERLLAYADAQNKFLGLWQVEYLNDRSDDFHDALRHMNWVLRFVFEQSYNLRNNRRGNWIRQYLDKRKAVLGDISPEDNNRIIAIADYEEYVANLRDKIHQNMQTARSGFTVQNCSLTFSHVLLLNRLQDYFTETSTNKSLFFNGNNPDPTPELNAACKTWLMQVAGEVNDLWKMQPATDADWALIKSTLSDVEKVDKAASPSLRSLLGMDPSAKFSSVIIEGGMSILRKKKGEALEKITAEKAQGVSAAQQTATPCIQMCKSWSSKLPQLAKPVNGLIGDMLSELKNIHGNKAVQAIGSHFENSDNPLLKEVLDEHPQIFKSINTIRFNEKPRLNETDTIASLEGYNVDKAGLTRACEILYEELEKLTNLHVCRGLPIDDLVADVKRSNLNSFTSDTLPILLAKIFTLWSALESEGSYDVTNNVQSINRPHPAQVVSIMRLFGIGFKEPSWISLLSDSFEAGRKVLADKTKTIWRDYRQQVVWESGNHLAEIKTGEGKSVTLAILCILFALMGQYPCCVCYSDILSARDFKSFENLFSLLGVLDRIAYSTITNMCEVILNRGKDIREETKKAVGFNLSGVNKTPAAVRDFGVHGSIEGLKSADASKRVLLIDEVDVLFTETFYGRCYNPSVLFQSDETKALVMDMWDRRGQIKNVHDILNTPQYKAMLGNFDGRMQPILSEQISAMWNDLKHIDEHHYEVTSDENIGYKRNDKISFHHEGFKTMFAYIKEFKKGSISETSMSQHVGISLLCGRFAYASMIKEFGVILGVTGTLANLSKFEMDAMEKNYSIKKNTYLPSMYGSNQFIFKEHDDVRVIFDRPHWHRFIQQQAQAVIDKQRSVLIFFETKELASEFQNSTYCKFPGAKNIQRIVEGETQYIDELVKKATHSGTITLITRAFGRGTDFICRDAKVTEQGGVHVIQTFFCDTITEEVQIKGRTARQGDPGSYEQILFAADLVQKFSLNLEELSEHMQTKGNDLYKYLCGVRLKDMESRVQDREKKVAESNEIHRESMDFFRKHLSTVAQGTFDSLQKIQNAEKVLIGKGSVVEADITPMHTIVCIDISGSMGGVDITPKNAKVPSHQKNRLGCVVEATKSYIANRSLQSPTDLVSIIAFDDKATVIVESTPINSPNIETALNILREMAGTSFDPAIKLAREIIEKQAAGSLAPYIFFLSDGDGTCSTALDDVAHLHQTNPSFRIDTIIFGPSKDGRANLENLAARGGGKFLDSVSSAEELEEVMIEASERYF